MKRLFRSEMSRLKKKLLLYFILVSIVSISVSAEIIFEMSSPRFRETIMHNFSNQLALHVPPQRAAELNRSIDADYVFGPVFELRNRMILLLIVVSASIISAFFLFTRDIVSPMDGMVDATKRIADGDLTVTVPVMSEDEIGQVARLINEMNVNLQDMIMQIRQEISRHMEQIIKASYRLSQIINDDMSERILKEKRLRISEFKTMRQSAQEVVHILENMSDELFALQKFVKMYKTYGQHTEILQSEIDKAFQRFTEGGSEEDE